MSGYRTPHGDQLGVLIAALEEHGRRLRELEVPTGTSINSLVDQVQQAIADIGTTIDAWLVANSYTKAQIDSLVASPGAIAPTTVTASGAVSAGGNVTSGGELAAAGKVRGGNIHGNILGSDYRVVYVTNAAGVAGELGYVPSSARFKRDIQTANIDVSAVRQLVVRRFRYRAAVRDRGARAAVEIGLIAEEVAALGLGFLIDQDEDGTPFGISYERLALALLPYVQSLDVRLKASEDEVAALRAIVTALQDRVTALDGGQPAQ